MRHLTCSAVVKPRSSLNLGTLDELMLAMRRSEGRNKDMRLVAMLNMLFCLDVFLL